MQQVAHLLALAAEADVLERVAEVVGEHPVGEDALVDLAHLPGAGDHPAAVDDRLQAEGGPVLLDQQLGGELGRAVERARALQRKVLGDARRGDARDVLFGCDLEPRLGLLQRQLDLRRDRVDAAGREEEEEGAGAARLLEAVVSAGEVRVDEVGGVAVDAAHHRGLGRALDQGIERAEAGEVVWLADVALHELDPGLLQAGQVELRAAPVEVVERDDLPLGVARGQRHCEVGADEAGAAGDYEAVQSWATVSPGDSASCSSAGADLPVRPTDRQRSAGAGSKPLLVGTNCVLRVGGGEFLAPQPWTGGVRTRTNRSGAAAAEMFTMHQWP